MTGRADISSGMGGLSEGEGRIAYSGEGMAKRLRRRRGLNEAEHLGEQESTCQSCRD